MVKSSQPELSVVVPLHDEAAGLRDFHVELIKGVKAAVKEAYEIVYVDDGSRDDTAKLVAGLAAKDSRLRLVKLSRNFGKENALAAGIAAARGQAVLTIDGDGQHPPEFIPAFVKAWHGGTQVVVGMRAKPMNRGWAKRAGSRLFYRLFNSFTDQKLLAGSTDYRLIDQAVRRAFLELGESDRITRGLIDWLGFRREFVSFEARPRQHGSETFNKRGLVQHMARHFVSLSPRPLYVFGYLGVAITGLSFVLGAAVFIEQLLLGDPWHWKFTGTAMLGILILFMVGIVLMSQGILSLYISHIHAQAKARPLYVIDREGSIGLNDD